MSAKDNMQPKQLKMFMTPDELHAEVQPGDFGPHMGGSERELTWDDPNVGWGRKLRRAKGVYDPDREYEPTPGLYESIEKHGIQEPVLVGHIMEMTSEGKRDVSTLYNGHHRVATATDLARQGREVYIPVKHSAYD